VKAFVRFARYALFADEFGWVECDAAGAPTGRFLRGRVRLPTPVALGTSRCRGRDRYDWLPDPEFPEPLTLVLLPDAPKFRAAFRKAAGRPLGCWCKIGEACHADAILDLMRECPDARP
jgi:hypothetical protein